MDGWMDTLLILEEIQDIQLKHPATINTVITITLLLLLMLG